uniref:Ig-like domain-containing protein n=1 Tax=Seriola dumerili TaxID=41447 RepID=A0A3B4UCQ6_SERDU
MWSFYTLSFISSNLSLHFITVVQTEASSWTIQVPSSVKGLPGSCVVIPCTFNYPDPDKVVTKFTGIWTDATSHVIYHPVESKIMQQYRSRTELLGDVTQRNCSLKIDPLQQTDQGPFYFRIEIADYNNFSFKENRVSISMTERGPKLAFSTVEGQTEVASCSVFPSCPTSPPVFNWSHSGEQIQSPQFDDGQWKVTANLTFRPTYADHNKPLLCTVTYKGGRKQEAAKVLKVKRKKLILHGVMCFYCVYNLVKKCFFVVLRKEMDYDDIHIPGYHDNDHVYGNMEVCEIFFIHSLFPYITEES